MSASSGQVQACAGSLQVPGTLTGGQVVAPVLSRAPYTRVTVTPPVPNLPPFGTPPNSLTIPADAGSLTFAVSYNFAPATAAGLYQFVFTSPLITAASLPLVTLYSGDGVTGETFDTFFSYQVSAGALRLVFRHALNNPAVGVISNLVVTVLT